MHGSLQGKRIATGPTLRRGAAPAALRMGLFDGFTKVFCFSPRALSHVRTFPFFCWPVERTLVISQLKGRVHIAWIKGRVHIDSMLLLLQGMESLIGASEATGINIAPSVLDACLRALCTCVLMLACVSTSQQACIRETKLSEEGKTSRRHKMHN